MALLFSTMPRSINYYIVWSNWIWVGIVLEASLRFVLPMGGVFTTVYFSGCLWQNSWPRFSLLLSAASLLVNSYHQNLYCFWEHAQVWTVPILIQMKSVFWGEVHSSTFLRTASLFGKNLWATVPGAGQGKEPLIFLACWQTSWCERDWAPVFSSCCIWGGASALWMGDGWRKRATDFSATLTRNFACATWSWRGDKFWQQAYPSETLCPLIGIWGEREPNPLDHTHSGRASLRLNWWEWGGVREGGSRL